MEDLLSALIIQNTMLIDYIKNLPDNVFAMLLAFLALWVLASSVK